MATFRAADAGRAAAYAQLQRAAARAVTAGVPKGEVAEVVNVHLSTLARWTDMPAHHNVARRTSDRRLRVR